MRAFLKNNRQAPRKVRLIARAVVGKNAETAVSELSFIPNKAAKTLIGVIESAVANARQGDANLTASELKVKNITVDKGVTYVRYMPRAFGRAAPIRKESSHIHVTLESLAVPAPKKTAVKKETKEVANVSNKTEKKTKAKNTSTETVSDNKEAVSNKK